MTDQPPPKVLCPATGRALRNPLRRTASRHQGWPCPVVEFHPSPPRGWCNRLSNGLGGRGGVINELLALLQTNGFTVFLTSDHGNTEAVGLGRPNEGVLADKAGERCRIYPDSTLRAKLKMSFPDVLTWENLSLPDNIYTALAPIGKAFVPLNATTVCHGGGTLEEVCVPFIIFPCDP